MKYRVLAGILSLSDFALAGCGSHESYHTSKYYQENPDALAKTLKFCDTHSSLTRVELHNCNVASAVNSEQQMQKAVNNAFNYMREYAKEQGATTMQTPNQKKSSGTGK